MSLTCVGNKSNVNVICRRVHWLLSLDDTVSVCLTRQLLVYEMTSIATTVHWFASKVLQITFLRWIVVACSDCSLSCLGLYDESHLLRIQRPKRGADYDPLRCTRRPLSSCLDRPRAALVRSIKTCIHLASIPVHRTSHHYS
jgi:predicted nucleic-acid-binding Zn-ribbon protein